MLLLSFNQQLIFWAKADARASNIIFTANNVTLSSPMQEVV